MSRQKVHGDVLARLDGLKEHELRRLLAQYLTERKLGLRWEADLIERDAAINADQTLPRLVPEWSCRPAEMANGAPHRNLIIEGDNYDALRLLRATHAGKIRVIYIDPPYNTGNKDWVYNDHYVGANDRWRHSQWLEFLYRRLTIARDLLTSDGVILVSINDESRAKLELLMDEAMPGRRLGTITWRTRQGSNADQDCFLSVDHEHVLVYGNSGFRFRGFEKSYEMYSNPDNDPRGDWRSSDLTLGFSYKERPNLYYPLFDEKTRVVYPPNPDRIWVYASQTRLKEGQIVATKTMEEFISIGQILFPKEQRVAVWNTMDELLAAIDTGDVPKSGKAPLLRRDLPGLEFWIGKKVGFGRPQFKRYKADLRNDTQPLSSWVVPTFEEDDYEADNSFVSGTNQEGARDVAAIFGDRAFNYAKPLSLIKNLLQQATQAHDIVLDFFGGSSTTAHAVLSLNAEDGGSRAFIVCSSTEASDKEPNKNLCRDVTAERTRRVIAGYSRKPGFTLAQGGEFAYLQLDHIDTADLPFELDSSHAFQWLSMQRFGLVQPLAQDSVQHVGRAGDCDIFVCGDVDASTVDAFVEIVAANAMHRIAVYCLRPETLREALSARGIEANTYSLLDTLLAGASA